jgi:hypothetical protein
VPVAPAAVSYSEHQTATVSVAAIARLLTTHTDMLHPQVYIFARDL